jgi:hypothetical protein
LVTGRSWKNIQDDREGGIFVGVAPDGCSASVPLGDRNAGIGWGKAMPYALWTADVACRRPSHKYPYYLEAMSVKMKQRHYTFDYSVDDVSEMLQNWGFGHYQANFRTARVDGCKLLEFTDGSLEKDVGMSDPSERADLLNLINNFFRSQHAYKRNDIVKLTVDMDAVPGSLTLYRREGDHGAWRQVGRQVELDSKRGSAAGWRFAVTLNSPYDVVHFWSGPGSGDKPPRLITMKQSGPRAPAAGGPAAAAAAGGGASGLRAGKELPEGSLSHWRYVRGPGDGNFADTDFVVFYHVGCGAVLEVAERRQADVVLQAALPPSLSTGDPYKIPSASATRHVLAVSAAGSMQVSAWKAPGLIRKVMQDLAAVAADPATADVAAGSRGAGWGRGDGCTDVSQRRLGGGIQGRRLVGADEGIEWHQLGDKACMRANKIGLEWKDGWRQALEWKNLGASQPLTGSEFDNGRLREALRRKTEFAPDEFARFGVTNLEVDSYIKVGDVYFKPSADKVHPPTAGNWTFETHMGSASARHTGALRPGVAEVTAEVEVGRR